ncbi:MAG: methylmalonyl-CoA mutase [Syntrophaceae bacterium CG2_30_49_12]|nr:MAG: methylmalonyl-CoA mutase [Syntrophaceae bacterium CG2_30_49_12]PIP05619.1 MAG: methylmalonyl-CoA mutase [Syntrophobacterales bacterium CG23_combo_of_CG06-09_8_20_14_all_48_27]PJA50360.1 MAG: methylmalonyl-CoA mutase [Syntrophobacterales bacterium CG_4_9_14_3_um_filter_49_8]PJC74469.1 MAG: methylmalonyl-CoA mutase [Syntrophobacterales bacterium CG_4_8_14_3_um_filter_49_14]
MTIKIRVVTGKIGLDDHYRGILSINKALTDAGMEVIYLGTGQRVGSMVETVLEEDADVVGLSFLCGGHLQIMQRFMNRLRERGLDKVLVIIGGVIPDQDIPKLKEIGVSEVFLPGTPLKNVVGFVRERVQSS